MIRFLLGAWIGFCVGYIVGVVPVVLCFISYLRKPKMYVGVDPGKRDFPTYSIMEMKDSGRFEL